MAELKLSEEKEIIYVCAIAKLKRVVICNCEKFFFFLSLPALENDEEESIFIAMQIYSFILLQAISMFLVVRVMFKIAERHQLIKNCRVFRVHEL